MSKRLNTLGKTLYGFVALFPLYVYWEYFFILKVFKNFSYLYLSLTMFLGLIIIFSPIIFFYKLLRKKEKPDKEIFVKSSQKDSKHLIYLISSFSPFLLFVMEIWKNLEFYNSTIIIGSLLFVLIEIIFVFKDEHGILYNIFFMKYNILNINDKNQNSVIILSKKDSLHEYIKVNQLNKEIFKEWN